MQPPGDSPLSRLQKMDLDPELFRQLGYTLVDQIAALFEEMPARPVTTREDLTAIQQMVEDLAKDPENGQDPKELLEKTTGVLLEHSLYNGHPKFWGYITSSPAPLGVLGDLLASAINPNVGACVLSPVATEIETQVINLCARFMGYPAGGGILVSGGNMANNVGFLAALRAKTGQEIRKTGFRSMTRQLLAYCSKETHTWIQKAADLYGLGTDSIRWIETAPSGQINLDSLEKQILEDLHAGHQPFLVTGTAGSVSTGVIDPLDQIASLCRKYDLWFHVDGAYGGFAAALPELKAVYKGLEAADSLAVDPHKWLYAPLEAGCALVKDPRHLTQTFSYHPPYYNFEQAGTNYVDYGPQNSRGFRALKVWLSLQHLGLDGHRQLIREDIQLAKYAYQTFEKLEDFEVFSHYLSITTFRYVPIELKERKREKEIAQYLDKLNQELLNRIETGGEYFLSKAIVRGIFTLRMCIVNFRTTTSDIDSFPDYIRGIGQALHAQQAGTF